VQQHDCAQQLGAAWSTAHFARTAQETADWIKQEMRIQSSHRGDDLRPAIVAALVAIASIAGILFDDFGPSNFSQDRGTAKMITAAAVSGAGAIEIPSELFVNPLESGVSYNRAARPREASLRIERLIR